MKKSKLYQLFTGLTTAEVRNISAFVHSPIFNNRKDVSGLCDYLLRQRNARKSEYGREMVWKTLFPEIPYCDSEMRLLMSRTYKLVEEYLTWCEYSKDTARQGIYRVKVFKQKKQEDHFRVAIKETEAQLQAQPLRNAAYLRNCFDLAFEFYEYLGGQKREYNQLLVDAINGLDAWYLSEKLRWHCGYLTQKAVVGPITEGLVAEVPIHYITEKPTLLENPSVQLWYTCYMALTDPDKAFWYEQLRQLSIENRSAFTDMELRDVYILCLNYYIKEWNKDGHVQSAQAGYELYKEGFEKGLLFVDGLISHFSYINAIAMALRVGEFAWAEHFIKAYKHKLDLKFRENTSLFCLARLRYEQGKTDDARELLHQYAPDDPYHFLISRNLLMKIYFEQDMTDSVDNLLESMRQYLRNKTKLGYQREYFENIVATARLLLYLPPGDAVALEKLRTKIQTIQVSSDREWFLKQVEKRVANFRKN